LNTVLTPQLQNLFNDAITINSTAFLDENPVAKEPIFVGSKTETALLKFAKEMGWQDYSVRRKASEERTVQVIPFSSERKAMGNILRLENGKYCIFLKGVSEILSKKCTRHVIVHKAGYGAVGNEIETREMDELEEDNINRTVIFYANQMLHTIALCYKDVDSWRQRIRLSMMTNLERYVYLSSFRHPRHSYVLSEGRL
jgi:Ca2+-transporting ATPase